MNKNWLAMTAIGALLGASALASAGECGPDALGTERTLTLKREYAAYGKTQHESLPLKKGEVVLTFDDGPRVETTPLVLKALADQCAKASFFMVGNNIAAHPDLARAVMQAGHSTGIHSYTHAHQGAMSPADQLADLKKTEDAYLAAFGTPTPAYRFPFLEETPTLLAALKAAGTTVMSVDLGIEDWEPNEQQPDRLAARPGRALTGQRRRHHPHARRQRADGRRAAAAAQGVEGQRL